MATHRTNLDALIPREDFEVKGDETPPSSLSTTLKISELAPDSLTYQVLRKPDFQRETTNWTPDKIVELIESFLDGDLIPSIILWRSPSTSNIFVIDGAHRLSALIAWVHDDYGDKQRSLDFYNNKIPPEQLKAAERTRSLIDRRIGSYTALRSAGQHPENSSPDQVRRARNLGSFAVQLQWVQGDAKRAEDSFFKINQKATPIDPTELLMIRSRRKPNAVAARALLRAGVGHKYWSAFPPDTQQELEELARQIYDILFAPVLEEPIKTLDLPVAGRGYSAESVRLVFEFVNLANGLITDKSRTELREDPDGRSTLQFLKRVLQLARRVSGCHPSSLGLHPAVYFYGATGRYQPSAFLGTVRFVQQLEQENAIHAFTSVRCRFEEFLLDHRYFTNQIVVKHGSGKKSLEPMARFFRRILESVLQEKNSDEIVADLQSHKDLRFLKELTAQDIEHKKEFSRETKSTAFLREALAKALRCAICGARVHKKSMTFDHKLRKQDGGAGSADNAQLAHPFCNTGFKERRHSQDQQTPLSSPSLFPEHED
ncbi:HNH endonuclease [Maioricimonas rarisocia]|uniref:HNH endonuclease n=1 Tax=Maioricimonas rarisocia TaxID=2528026 RepID=A0A517Z032_9PLAN|nr:DUF262 domain-containing protein [Maioricimonas rarisocia]QDU35858.1 HNH endonuclease [Maioricimonas rarisocia]